MWERLLLAFSPILIFGLTSSWREGCVRLLACSVFLVTVLMSTRRTETARNNFPQGFSLLVIKLSSMSNSFIAIQKIWMNTWSLFDHVGDSLFNNGSVALPPSLRCLFLLANSTKTVNYITFEIEDEPLLQIIFSNRYMQTIQRSVWAHHITWNKF